MTIFVTNAVSMPSTTRPLNVYIMQEAKLTLDAYVDAVKTEISGLGTVSFLGQNSILIEGIYLLKQKVSGVEAQMDPNSMKNFIPEARRRGIDINKIRLWWHSHANSSAFWSSSGEPNDLDTIESFKDQGAEWMLSLVTNQRGEYLTRLDIYHPVRIALDGLPLITVTDAADDFKQAIALEVAEKVELLPPPKFAMKSLRVRSSKQTRVRTK